MDDNAAFGAGYRTGRNDGVLAARESLLEQKQDIEAAIDEHRQDDNPTAIAIAMIRLDTIDKAIGHLPRIRQN